MTTTGAAAWRVARCGTVSDKADSDFRSWLADGCNASMTWLADKADMRRDPSLLLSGATSVIVAAFPYRPAGESPRPRMAISLYALGRDYHAVLRERLAPVAEAIDAACGSQSRICVDSAPLRERYWAVEAGLGRIGRNNLLLVPGLGSMLFLGSILTTARIEPDSPLPPSAHPCADCDAPCVRACPTHAIRPDSTVDARRCLAYLTIEHRGQLPEGTRLHGRVFGCDACALACPRNRQPLPPGQPLPDFAPLPETMSLDADELTTMSQRAFARRFAHSPLSRARTETLLRNLRHDD